MRKFYFLLGILFAQYPLFAQTIDASGACITGNITLNAIADINGKPAYQGSGTVDGFANVQVSVYWIGETDNVWVLDFDGQPYFQNSCNTSAPPGTSNASCSWAPVSGTTCSGTAALALAGSGVLPVRLVSFTAAANPSAVLLNWVTASETNNKGFEIQRSTDGASWKSVGFVAGAGTTANTTHYNFNDPGAMPGINYYRLLQQDFDGRFMYSPIVSVTITRNGFYTLTKTAGSSSYQLHLFQNDATISLVDMHGRRLQQTKLSAGVHNLNLDAYAPGMYLLQLQQGNNMITEKLVK